MKSLPFILVYIKSFSQGISVSAKLPQYFILISQTMNRKILNLALPNIISNITIPVLGLVDLSILGHLESEVYIGAIAIGGIVFNFIYWGFSFLRMGTSGFTAQAYGKKKPEEMIMVLTRALYIGLLLGIVIFFLQKPIGLFSFWIMDGSPEVEKYASQYFYIRILAAPATLCLYSFNGWFIGMQNARFPMIVAIFINLANIGFNLYFVYIAGMKSDGVAWGTVLAQYSGLLLASVLFYNRYRKLFIYFKFNLINKRKELKKFFHVNKDILIRTICLIFTFSFFTNQSAQETDTLLAANQLLLQFLFMFSYFIDGFANASEALVGKYTGAENMQLLKVAIRKLFVWGIGISIPFTIIYALFNDEILSLLTNNIDIIQSAKPYRFWVSLIPLLSFSAFIWDGIYIGATASKAMRNTMIAATLVVFIPAYYISKPLIDHHSLWFSLLLFMLARSIGLSLLFKKNILSIKGSY